SDHGNVNFLRAGQYSGNHVQFLLAEGDLGSYAQATPVVLTCDVGSLTQTTRERSAQHRSILLQMGVRATGRVTRVLVIRTSTPAKPVCQAPVTPLPAATVPSTATVPMSLISHLCRYGCLFDCDRLGQVARLVDIGAALYGDVVGKQLQEDRQYSRCDEVAAGVHTHQLPAGAVQRHVGSDVGKHIQLAAACAYFFQIRLELLEQLVVGCDCDDRHILVHQRERTMLEFASGIGLGVDVGNFLELERAFHGHRVLCAATEKQRMAFVHEGLREFRDLRSELQRVIELAWQAVKLGNELGQPVGGDAPHTRQLQYQQGQCSELGGEGLGRGHAYLRAGTGHQGQVGLAHQA